MDGIGDGPGDTTLGGFLRSRRSAAEPARFGIAGGGRRRVPGLRREELAQLAGISVDYYVRLEQGRARQPSPEVLGALARVLGLTDTERSHLERLATTRRGGGAPPRPRPQRVPPEVRRMLDAMAGMPALLLGFRQELLAWNTLGSALYGGLDDRSERDRNAARLVFLDPIGPRIFPDWDSCARDTAGQLRLAAGRYPDDRALAELVGELTMKSAEFRRLWSAGDVAARTSGRRRYRHPAVGDLTLSHQAFRMAASPSEPEPELLVFSADPDSASASALALLSSWTATEQAARTLG